MADRITAGLHVEDFERFYLAANRPCIFQAQLTNKWRCRQNWVRNGKPNFAYLKDHFGNSKVPVANCSQKHHNAHFKTEMQFEEFVNYWESLSVSPKQDSTDLLYLKDWHFQREYPEYRAYEVLDYFKSDWLNEFFDIDEQVADDYRFVYMGPRGTWTAFHADVFRSYSWSANICGRKTWILYPPGEEENLKDSLGNLPFDVTSDELKDKTRFSNASDACEPIQFIQEEGEVVFIPSGWYHQVHNLEDTISINHNWINSYGLDYMFQHLKMELSLVEKEIAEHREADGWREQCQLILKCSAGMDYEGFYKMVILLMKPRIKLLKKAVEWKKARLDNEANPQPIAREIFNAFKRLDVSCAPREHLQYDNLDSTETANVFYCEDNLLHNMLENRISKVTVDLKKLLENFRNLERQDFFNKDMMDEEMCMVLDVERTLGTYDIRV